jgi:C4-dicarboxylate-specific signal transduction histidine kinase
LECLLERIHGDDRAALQETFRQSEAESFDIRCRLVFPQGRIKYLRIVGRTFEVSGPVVTYAGAFMDCTEAKISEEKLHQADAALAHVTRVIALGELAASIAHEINQPLTGLVSNGEACVRWLDREIPNLVEVRTSVERMVADSRRAAEVVSRLRTLVKKSDLAYAAVSINDVIAETAPLIYRELSAHDTALVLQLGADAPKISGDKIHLQQVIINLAINGIQAMAGVTDRPTTLTIYTGARADGSLQVSVVDAGTGIKPEHSERLFDAFFSTKTSGLGMGLSICRSIIESHRGEIRAFNNPHQGATVSFWIPRCETAAPSL